MYNLNISMDPLPHGVFLNMSVCVCVCVHMSAHVYVAPWAPDRAQWGGPGHPDAQSSAARTYNIPHFCTNNPPTSYVTEFAGNSRILCQARSLHFGEDSVQKIGVVWVWGDVSWSLVRLVGSRSSNPFVDHLGALGSTLV